MEGERDSENLYFPQDVYRAARAPGFASQVPIIDITPLRQATAHVGAILDLLGVPEEPHTRIIVDHLRHCIATETPPSDLTYTILNERVDAADDLSAIDELKETAFIYDAVLKRFLTSDQVFWHQPPFGDYWRAASSRMAQREPLYSRLGVRNQPGPSNFAALMIEIAGKSDITETDVAIHSQCLSEICEALDASDPDAEDAVAKIIGDLSLLNVDGQAVWPEDAAWIDSEQLVVPFGCVLNYLLVQPPSMNRGAAARLFRRLKVRSISDIARLRLAMEPDRILAEEATDRLHDRADLLLWLAPNARSLGELRQIVSSTQIRLTLALSIRAEIDDFDPPVQSRVSNAPAYYEREAGVLHVRGEKLRQNEWVAAFRAVFSEIERFCPLADVKPLVMTAAFIMLPDTREEAEEALRISDFRPPEDELDGMPLGEQLGDLPKEETGSDQGVWDEGTAQVSKGSGTADEIAKDMIDDDRTIGTPEVVGNEAGRRAGNTGEQHGGPREQRDAARGSTNQHGASDEAYKSKAGTGEFGAEENPTGEGSGALRRTGIEASGMDPPGTNRRREGRGERKTRTSRMLAYVARAGERGKDDSEQGAGGSANSNLVDIAAIRAALSYEENRGWRAEEQPHNNPGYDIISANSDGKRRLIEVKGLEGEWTERGIKLTHVQYGMAEQYADEYWIYVVESARDLDRQRVSAISNPFQKVEEYWFDYNWRGTAEETANSRQLNVRVGARVRHAHWRTGTIIEVEQRGIALMVKVDFGKLEGVKYIPFNSLLQLID